jgi:hypothetical protein
MPTPTAHPSLVPPAGVEIADHYANTSLYFLELLAKRGALCDMRVLSLGSRVSHITDYVGLFRTLYHNTTVPTYLPMDESELSGRFVLLERDFFELPPLEVDAVISQAAIHCLSDSRYGNQPSLNERRPYAVGRKLRQILPLRPVPIVVSVAVNRDEYLLDTLTHLSHDAFIESFTSEGFALQDSYFDYLSGGWPLEEEYQKPQYRRHPFLPVSSVAQWHYVQGTYFFL